MTLFLTGATGFIGNALLRSLLDRANKIHILVRPHTPFSFHHPHVQIFRGDLDDVTILREGMRRCEAVFHLGALVGIGSKDRSFYDRANIEGTRHIIEAASAEGVRKVIYTSSVIAIGPSDGIIADEETVRKTPFLTDYERTKAIAEQEVMMAARNGFPAVVVAPSLVFGPTPSRMRYSFNRFLFEFATGKWLFIPGSGNQVMNAVYIDDVVQGHILALEQGKVGERYILGGENVTINELAQRISCLLGMRRPLPHISLSVLKRLSWVEVALAKFQGREPRISPQSIEIYRHDWAYSSNKAENQLQYRPIPLQKGLEKTLAWISQEGGHSLK